MMFLALLIISSLATAQPSAPTSSLIQAVFGRTPTDTCVPQTNGYCNVVNAVHATVGSGQLALTLQSILILIRDDESLHFIFLVFLQQLSTYMAQNPDKRPADFDSILEDISRIVLVLEEKGTTGVVWKDLKPYVQRLLNIINPTQRHKYFYTSNFLRRIKQMIETTRFSLVQQKSFTLVVRSELSTVSYPCRFARPNINRRD